MKNKINKVKRELRAIKKSSHAIERLIQYQGLRFTRIRALEALPREKKRDAIIENEKELINALGIDKLVLENEEMEKKYKEALNALSPEDRAMVTDFYFCGLPYWKIAMEYGFSESGARKHLDRIVEKIAKVL